MLFIIKKKKKKMSTYFKASAFVQFCCVDVKIKKMIISECGSHSFWKIMLPEYCRNKCYTVKCYKLNVQK